MNGYRVAFAVALLVAPPAWAGTFSGHVWDQAVNVPLSGAQVRVWKRVDSKTWAIVHTPTTNGSGLWTQVVGPGEYKIEAGGNPSGNMNQGGRWYDVAAPNASGWVGEDADVLEGQQDQADLDVVLPINGGFDVRVLASGTPVGGIQARLVRGVDPRIHHNDQTRSAPHLGRFYMRSLVPADDHVLLLHDPTGAHALTTFGPYDVDAGVNLQAGDVTLLGPHVDTYEPNGSPTATGAMSVNGVGLHQSPPVPWTSVSSGIGATSDRDFYCWTAAAGDRYILSTTSVITAAGHTFANPWLDPMVSFWDARTGSPVRLLEDDDSGPDRDARLDTLDVPFAGKVCAAVTTFGDSGWNGAGQSVGTYTIEVEMGNRRPLVVVTRDGEVVPPAPESTVVDEGVEIVLDVTLIDPEGDTPYTDAEFVDAFGLQVEDWSYVVTGDTAVFSWTPGPTAADGGPYVLSIESGDDELSGFTDVIVAVAAVNIPPEMPTLLSPEDGATLAESFPELSVVNGTDIDEDDLWVEFEAYLDTADPPWDAEVVPQDAGGVTSWTTEFVPDATQIWWRARTWDGQAYSAWTGLSEFLVATINDPPTVPILDKPSLGEVVLLKTPALSAWTSTDPERDDIDLLVEVSLDSTFETLFASSDPVPEDPLVATTTWTLDTPLAWSDVAFWRARAIDSRGAESDWSDVSWFRVKANVQPTTPGLLAPFGPTCQSAVVHELPTSIEVTNAVDPEGEPVSLEVHVFEGDAGETDPPIYTTTAPQSAGASTEVPVVLTLDENTEYRVAVRASDGTDPSEWAQCWFWFDAVDSPTTGFAINEPIEGDVLVSHTVTIDAEIANPTDPDDFVAGSTLSLAWCLQGGDLVCPAAPADWGRLAFASGLVTTFQVAGFVPDTDWTLKACAIDELGTCRATDEVAFRTATPYDEGGDDTDDDADDTGGGSDDEGPCGCNSGPSASFAWVVLAALIRRRR